MSVVELKSSDHHKQFVNTPSAVVFFGSKRCGYCKQMKPVVQDMSKKHSRTKFGHVETTEMNVDNLEAVPIFIGYKNGEPVAKVRGADVKQLQEMVNQISN